jgi:hypothetical protein
MIHLKILAILFLQFGNFFKMKAELFIDGKCFNCFRGGYVSCNDVQSRQNPLKIAFMAEGHYGEVKCGVKLMTISGKEETFYFGGYDDELVDD